jgi:peptidylprolyl isomerase
MNTKAVIGIIIVLGIIGVAVWLHKAPASPAQPTTPVSTITGNDTMTETPVVPNTPAPSTASPSSQATAGEAGVKSSIISTKTVNGMKIETTKEGTGVAIKNGQTAEMLYTGKLDNGSVFDSTASRGNQPFSFTLGVGQVIKGWDEGVLGMKVGEERTLIIPADLAYGAHGFPPVIPANATLTFDVTLVGIK